MDRANKTVVNLNLKDLTDAPQSYEGQRGKLVAVNDTETGVNYTHVDEFIDKAGIDKELDMLADRLEQIEQKNTQLAIENDILFNRESASSHFVMDMMMNENLNDTGFHSSATPAELMANNDWNDNWKFDENANYFKQGFMRPRKQPFMMEVIDEYNLTGIGQIYKANISQYDIINDCYWMITNGGQNTLGEIVKLSPLLKENRVIILGRWYLAAAGAGTAWTLMQVESTGTKLFFGYYLSAVSKMYSILINSDGSLGKVGYKKYNGDTIDLINSISHSITDTTASSFIMGIAEWSETEMAYLLCVGTTVTLKFFLKADLTIQPTVVTGFGDYVGGSTSYNRAICKIGNDLYIKINDGTDSKRFIYKFNVLTDIYSNAAIKASGRFETARNVSENAESGITISKEGDLLEVVSTNSNGTFIARHALRDALWTESTVCAEIKTTTYGTNDSRILYIDDSYIYYVTNNTNANLVRIYKRNRTTNIETCTIVGGGGWTSVEAMTIASISGTEYVFLVGNASGTTFYSRVILRNTFEAQFGDPGAPPTLNVSTAGLAFTGYESAKVQHGITTDGTYLYIICDTDDAIDRWTLAYPPVKDTDNYITIIAAITDWRGIAYKNNKFYISDYNSAGIKRIWSIKSTPTPVASGKTGFMLHQYQDPSNVLGDLQCVFGGNDLYFMQYNSRIIRGIKTLEDPDVLQIQSMNLCANNVLLTDNAYVCSKIVDRYFEPDEFSDVRNVPDKNYMAVGYRDEGFSVLHLDAYLSGKSSTGKDRYDISKIRTWHYKLGTAFTTAYSQMYAIVTAFATSICIERDMIFATRHRADNIDNVVMVDLKAGKVYYVGSYNNSANGSGQYSTVPLNDRNNEPFGVQAITNPELMLTLGSAIYKVHAQTFDKNDITDYNGTNPKTFVTIIGGGGTDVLVIDWDDDNNRVPIKVWNNIGNNAVVGQWAAWIAPSGYMFFGAYNSGGTISMTTIPVWEIAADSLFADTTKYREIVNSSAAVFDISPQSACWKTPSGQWRHKLIIGSNSDAGYPHRIALIDVENNLMEIIYTGAATTYYWASVTGYEDKIFSKYSYTSTNDYIGASKWLKKRRIDFNPETGIQGTWDIWQFPSGETPHSNTRPYLSNGGFNTGAAGFRWQIYNRYSKDFNILGVAFMMWGLQFFFFPQLDNCEYVSKEFEINSPSELIYKQSNMIPMASETV